MAHANISHGKIMFNSFLNTSAYQTNTIPMNPNIVVHPKFLDVFSFMFLLFEIHDRYVNHSEKKIIINNNLM